MSDATPARATTTAADPGEPRSRLAIRDLGHPVLVGLVALVAVVALAARFVVRSPLWLDEALSVNIAKLPLGDIPRALHHDGHPPLYYVLLHGWMSLFGSGDRAVRALSGLISLAGLPLAYRAGRRVAGPRLGWTTVVVFALSPYFLRYGSETRMYSLLMVLVLAGYLLVTEALERTTALRLVGIAVVVSALLWTHYWSMWLIAAVGLLLVGRLAVQLRRGEGIERRAAAALGAVVVGVIGFVPWLPTLAYQSVHTGTPWAKPFRPATMLVTSIQDFNGGPYSEPQVLTFLTVVLVVIGVFGRGIDAWRVELDLHTRREARVPAALLVLTMVLASIAGMITHSAFSPRYAAVFFPFFAILVALGLDHFRGALTRNAVLAVFLVLSCVGLFVVFRLTRTEAGAVADAIREADAGPALVVTCPDQLGPAVRRAVPARIEVTTYPRFADPHRVDWVDYQERNRHNDPGAFATELLQRAGDRTIFVAFNNGYRTLGNQCADMLTTLGASRTTRLLVDADQDRYYEAMSLYELTPKP
jgi:preprotein translocase subunit Sss1